MLRSFKIRIVLSLMALILCINLVVNTIKSKDNGTPNSALDMVNELEIYTPKDVYYVDLKHYMIISESGETNTRFNTYEELVNYLSSRTAMDSDECNNNPQFIDYEE